MLVINYKNLIQSNLSILVTLEPDTFGLNREVVAIQMTLINQRAEYLILLTTLYKFQYKYYYSITMHFISIHNSIM